MFSSSCVLATSWRNLWENDKTSTDDKKDAWETSLTCLFCWMTKVCKHFDRNISWKTLDKLPYRWLVFSQCCPFVAVRFIKHRTSNPAGDSGHTETKIRPKKPWKWVLFLYFLESHALVLLVRLALLSFPFSSAFSLPFVCVNVGIWFLCFRSQASTLPAHTFPDCG